jgi:ACS family tartrate transporter-like MFS transporter
MATTRNATAQKVWYRLALPTILFMLLSSLDRTNVSFAALHMNRDLGFSPSQYGFGAGILFLGFIGGQYPSVLLMQRIGFRRWLATIAVLWGACAAGLSFVHTPMQFYVVRVMLGLAEGGLAPGIVLYLTQFATDRERATTFATPMLAVPVSIIIGGPLSGWLMQMSVGIAGWRWMFIAEAVPAILFGIAAFFYFPDTPRETRFLSAEEKNWLEKNAAGAARPDGGNDWSMLKHPLIWMSALLWLLLLSGAYGIMFWLPQMVGELTSLTPLEIGFVNALPWIGLAIGIYFNSAHSDRTGERFWHIAIPAAVTGAALLVAWELGPGIGGLIALFVAGLGLGGAQGAFWALPTSMLTPRSLAVAAVAINMAGSSGGLFMPDLVGIAREETGSFAGPTLLIASVLFAAALLVLIIKALFFRGGTPQPARAV